jgi:hypothetical protein
MPQVNSNMSPAGFQKKPPPALWSARRYEEPTRTRIPSGATWASTAGLSTSCQAASMKIARGSPAGRPAVDAANWRWRKPPTIRILSFRGKTGEREVVCNKRVERYSDELGAFRSGELGGRHPRTKNTSSAIPEGFLSGPSRTSIGRSECATRRWRPR